MLFAVKVKKKNRNKEDGKSARSSSGDSTLSSEYFGLVMERLKSQTNRKSTSKNYLSIWREFNQFPIRLDRKPEYWEDRVALFCTYLVDNGRKSTTIRSYISAIKSVLKIDGYLWNESRVQLTALINACKIVNDTVKTRLPINGKLLELILFEVDRIFIDQYYFSVMYKVLFVMAYCGLMRIGELAMGEHQVLARNVHVGQNKRKILIILFSSKTHSKADKPQRIHITANNQYDQLNRNMHFCLFRLIQQYCNLRGGYEDDAEPFFLFSDFSNISPSHVRTTLRKILKQLGLEDKLYDTHSFRIGCGVDMLKCSVPVAQIRLAGRWRSNTVYKYITA